MRISLVFLLLVSICGRANAQSVDMELARAKFATDLHPKMRQNCASCHGEEAWEDDGPLHSAQDPDRAFDVFKRYVNWGDLQSSRIMGMVKNEHFCRRFHSTSGICDSGKQTGPQMVAALEKYFKDIFVVNSSAAVIPLGDEAERMMRVSSLRAHEGFKVLTIDKVVPDGKDVFRLNFPVVGSQPGIDKPNRLQLSVEFTRFSGDYFKITSLQLGGREGSLEIRGGMNLYINEQPVAASIGLESLNRIVMFNPRLLKNPEMVMAPEPVATSPQESEPQKVGWNIGWFSRKTAPNPVEEVKPYVGLELTSSRPIIVLKPGDRIQFAFGDISVLQDVKFPQCDQVSARRWPHFVLANMYSQGDRGQYWCNFILSLVDVASPRRSVLLREANRIVPSDFQMPEGMRAEELAYWIQLAQPK